MKTKQLLEVAKEIDRLLRQVTSISFNSPIHVRLQRILHSGWPDDPDEDKFATRALDLLDCASTIHINNESWQNRYAAFKDDYASIIAELDDIALPPLCDEEFERFECNPNVTINLSLLDAITLSVGIDDVLRWGTLSGHHRQPAMERTLKNTIRQIGEQTLPSFDNHPQL